MKNRRRMTSSDELCISLNAKTTSSEPAITSQAVFVEGLIIVPLFHLIGKVIRCAIRNIIGNTWGFYQNLVRGE
jgi:hypothetical protein